MNEALHNLIESADLPVDNAFGDFFNRDALHRSLFGFGLIQAIQDNRINFDEDKPARKEPHDPDTEREIMSLFRVNLDTTFIAQALVNPDAQWCYLRNIWPVTAEEALGTEKSKALLRQSMVNLLEPFRGNVAVWRQRPYIERVKNGPLVIHARVHLMLWNEYVRILPEALVDKV